MRACIAVHLLCGAAVLVQPCSELRLKRTVWQEGGRVAQLVEEGVREGLHRAVPLRRAVLQQLGHLRTCGQMSFQW